MTEFVRNMLVEQRKRTVGNLMTYIENNVYPRLPAGQRTELRGKILETIGGYHDLCLDMLKASVSDGSIVNEEAVRLMAELHAEVRGLRKEMRRGDL